ncbi:hypothetical protein HBE96_16500 [Clostridium sp. P21]|uniref:Uncharacterized protein n=1 Tax=Clostridium muellerianum TaxID=2716538 RepID=A0A7Y0EJF6_9CLOT|nr:hypothetical protein [Clostridium muellerianum]NMM64227.1 hypothetical protein [Clostridium muellerianum]
MIHTAKFYLKLSNEDINFLENKYWEFISLTSCKIDDVYKEKGIATTFTKIYSNWYMYCTIDFIKLIGKADIKEADYSRVQDKINQYLYDIFQDNKRELILIRLDYRLDVKIETKKDRELIMYLYNKTAEKYKFKRKYNQYDITIYFNSKSIQSKCYDKEAERISKSQPIEKYEEDVLRFEVVLENKHLNYMKRQHNIEKTLKKYFSDTLYKKYMEENLGVLLYEGDYYKIYLAEKIIKESEIKESDKKALRELLVDISKHTVTGAMEITNDKDEKKYSKYKFAKYLRLLGAMKINPILIPKNMKSPSYVKNPFCL